MNNFYENIKNTKKPYIIAEIGSNHNGDMDLAKKIIDEAVKCACDCVKFQSFNEKSLICNEEYEANTVYNDSKKKHFGSLREMVEKYYLRKEQHYELNEYCNKVGITFASTPFSYEEADLLENIGVDFFKIASMDVNNIPLIKYIAKKHKPIMLSTGMATLAEIENAVKAIESEGNKEIILLHCIATYPPKYEDINLLNIPMMEEIFGYPTGFSDHSIGVSIPLASSALGAKVIEKHFTLNKDLPGWDHEISADPAEMKIIVKESANISTALGSKKRIVSADEEMKKEKFRRSIVISKDMTKGDIITENDIWFKRPGTQIPPDEYKFVIGKKLNKDKKYDDLLKWEDLA